MSSGTGRATSQNSGRAIGQLASYHPQTDLAFLPEHMYKTFLQEHFVLVFVYLRYDAHMAKTKKRKLVRKSRRIGDIRASADEPTRDQREEWYRPRKKPVTLRLDADVIAWFKTAGKGYQTRINRELRRIMINAKEKG